MALVLDDRVKETSTTTGTGTLNLSGAVSGFQTFVAGIGDGNTTYYAIVNRDEAEWETGLGTVTDIMPSLTVMRRNGKPVLGPLLMLLRIHLQEQQLLQAQTVIVLLTLVQVQKMYLQLYRQVRLAILMVAMIL